MIIVPQKKKYRVLIMRGDAVDGVCYLCLENSFEHLQDDDEIVMKVGVTKKLYREVESLDRDSGVILLPEEIDQWNDMDTGVNQEIARLVALVKLINPCSNGRMLQR